MSEVTEGLRRWHRHLVRDIAAWSSAPLALGVLALLSSVGWVRRGEVEWWAITWGVIGWVFGGGFKIRRTLLERPEPARSSELEHPATSHARSWHRRLWLDLAACAWPAIAYGVLSAVWLLGVLGIDETTLRWIGWVAAVLVLVGAIKVIRTLRRRPSGPVER